MTMTIKEMMDLPILDTSTVLTARNTLDQRFVEWVSVIEMPVENFVRKNEFVLTTCMGCDNDPELILEFVQDVYQSGASALAIAQGRHVFNIPSDVLQFAESKGFILIDIPWEIRFADITQTVIDRLNTVHKEELKKSEETQQHMINLILQGKGLSDIANYVWKKVQKPIIITDKAGSILGYSHRSGQIIEKWNQYLQSNQLPLVSSTSETLQDPSPNEIHRIHYETVDIFQILIQSAGKQRGYLFLFSYDGEMSLDVYINNLLEHAVTASALWFLKESAIEETEMRLQDDFIWNLAQGDILSLRSMYSKANLLGYNLDLSYTCILGYPESYETTDQNEVDRSYCKHQIEGMIYYIKEGILYAAEAVKHQVMITYQNDHILVFLETFNDQNYETVSHFLDLVERRLSALLPGLHFSWGISKHKDGVMKFQESFEEAQTTLHLGRFQKGTGQRTTYQDTKMNRLLLHLADNQKVREVTQSTLSPLVDYKKKRDMDLIGTFRVYNRNKGNVSQTARELNLHRQSLLYRLRKIESLTDLSLFNSEDQFLLELSIKIWTLSELKEVSSKQDY